MYNENTYLIQDEELNYTGRESNKELGNFRLLGKSKHQQYFTSVELSRAIYEILSPLIKDEAKVNVLDPTCGSGRLLYPWKKAGQFVTGIELDKEPYDVAVKLLGKISVRKGDILTYANYLSGYQFAISNPPYGIWWNVAERHFDFTWDSESYEGNVESQTAVLEIITKALDYNGVIALIIPSNMFENSKDKGFREHLYKNYQVAYRATITNAFKKEYNINVDVDLIIAQNNYRADNSNIPHDTFNGLTDPEYNSLILKAKTYTQDFDTFTYHHKMVNIPRLDSLRTVAVKSPINITAKGVKTTGGTKALLDFLNSTVEEYSTMRGMRTGLTEAILSPAVILKDGTERAEKILSRIGFDVKVSDKDREIIDKAKAKFQFLCVPIYRPKPHQLLAYMFDKDYIAKETVKDTEGKLLFIKDKSYDIHPTWIRRRETVNIQNVVDENRKQEYELRTEIDRGYLTFKIETESGERLFSEINKEEIALFTSAFTIPDVQDISIMYPEKVMQNRMYIEKNLPFLFPYQKEDVARLACKPFGYIGYDMGGGKTVTSAAWATVRKYKRVLVVATSGLVDNWYNELKKFGFNVKRMTTHATIDQIQKDKRSRKQLAQTEFYVTSYEFLSLDTAREYYPWECIKYDKDGNILHQESNITSSACPVCNREYKSAIKECPECGEIHNWTGENCLTCGYSSYTYTPKKRSYPAYKRVRKLFSAVIVDEAQQAKSKNSDRGRAVRAIKCKGKLILSGTLMKGYITDLYWNIGWLLGFGNPLFHYEYRGGSKAFLDEFGSYEYVTKQYEETLSEGRAKLLPEVSNLNRFWRIFASFTIRRLKDEMIQLPPKNRNVLVLEMDETHKSYYNQFAVWAKDEISRAIRNAEKTGEVNMGIISRSLWKLRFAGSVPTAESYLCDDYFKTPYTASSWNKLEKITELVKDIQAKGEKVIIFSGLRPMVSAICDTLKQSRIKYIPITASTSTSKRLEQINLFAADPECTAIVTGLNVLNRGYTITCATNIIITDIDYSPEATQQAEDRAHRTGQTRPVNIYYLFSRETIDETMYSLTNAKASAISSAIDGKARYKDVEELLKEKSGNIQMQIAEELLKAEVKPFQPLSPVFNCTQEIQLPDKPKLATQNVVAVIPETERPQLVFGFALEKETIKPKKKTVSIPENQLQLFA